MIVIASFTWPQMPHYIPQDAHGVRDLQIDPGRVDAYGRPCVFVRLAARVCVAGGAIRRMVYGRGKMTLDGRDAVEQQHCSLVEVTGGEPLRRPSRRR